MRELEIYVHIPFCVKKCAYCDFLSAPASSKEQEAYVQTLIGEIAGAMPACARSFLADPIATGAADPSACAADPSACAADPAAAKLSASGYRLSDDYVVTSVFIGGGTPSLLPAEQISGLLDALRAQFRFSDDPEVTIECNPGTVDRKKLETYRACGVNRLSFGAQSADDGELKKLGRIHTWEMVPESCEAARAAGFTNINLDLMSALPGQTVSSWERTLQQALALNPSHISAYSLIIEEGTPFYERYHEDDLLRAKGDQPRFLPSEEEERQMYERTKELLRDAGLYRYEISNYARPGYACRHNLGYWRGTEYMGFGLGASSLLRFEADSAANDVASGQLRPVSVRLKNPSGFADYARLVQQGAGAAAAAADREIPAQRDESCEDCEILSEHDEMAEFMILGLRMTDGVSAQEFLRRFGCPVDRIYGETIRKYVSLGLLRQEGDRVFLTPRGLDLSNTVMAEFL